MKPTTQTRKTIPMSKPVGNLSPASAAKIRAKANKVLGK
jgi:hypothetical protein